MSMIERRRRVVPGLNTASLPDLIFTVLFFFMIVTHMRTETVKVEYHSPQGTELARLNKKSSVVHVYIGKPLGWQSDGQTASVIQVGDKVVSLENLPDYIREERKRMSPEEAREMTVSIRADKDTPMRVITEVKQALRQAKALRISYSAEEVKTDKK